MGDGVGVGLGVGVGHRRGRRASAWATASAVGRRSRVAASVSVSASGVGVGLGADDDDQLAGQRRVEPVAGDPVPLLSRWPSGPIAITVSPVAIGGAGLGAGADTTIRSGPVPSSIVTPRPSARAPGASVTTPLTAMRSPSSGLAARRRSCSRAAPEASAVA